MPKETDRIETGNVSEKKYNPYEQPAYGATCECDAFRCMRQKCTNFLFVYIKANGEVTCMDPTETHPNDHIYSNIESTCNACKGSVIRAIKERSKIEH